MPLKFRMHLNSTLSIGKRGLVSRGWGTPPSEGPRAHDMIGLRADCIDKVRRWCAAGIHALYLVPRGPDPLGQMQLLMNEVASQV